MGVGGLIASVGYGRYSILLMPITARTPYQCVAHVGQIIPFTLLTGLLIARPTLPGFNLEPVIIIEVG